MIDVSNKEIKNKGKRERERREKSRKSNEKTFDQTIVSIWLERKKNTLQLQCYKISSEDMTGTSSKATEWNKEKFSPHSVIDLSPSIDR